MRIETVINSTRDLGCNARLPNLDTLQPKARACNRRILEAERVGQGRVYASPAFERIAHPAATADGGRTPALPLTAADQPQAPPELKAALRTITHHVDAYAAHARLPKPTQS